MDEQKLEDIQFRQDFISKDSSSPLHMIREKEMEISGCVLAAKKEAEQVVAEARRKAAEVVNAAEEEGDELAGETEKTLAAEADSKAAAVLKKTEEDVKVLEKTIVGRRDAAVEAVVKMVTDG